MVGFLHAIQATSYGENGTNWSSVRTGTSSVRYYRKMSFVIESNKIKIFNMLATFYYQD